MPVSWVSTANVWSHEVTAVCTVCCGNVVLPPRDDFIRKWARPLGEITREFRNCEATVMQNCLPHTFHQFWRHQGRSGTTVFVVHIVSTFSELLSAPSSDHTAVSQLAGDYISAAILSLRCAITTVVTRLKLHCIIPTYSFSTATHAHSHPTSHIISGCDWNLLPVWASYFLIGLYKITF